jgi:hypothetical protein
MRRTAGAVADDYAEPCRIDGMQVEGGGAESAGGRGEGVADEEGETPLRRAEEGAISYRAEVEGFDEAGGADGQAAAEVFRHFAKAGAAGDEGVPESGTVTTER